MVLNIVMAAVIMAQPNDFPLVTVNGDTVWFSSFRGRPLVVIFWSPWCPHCRHELPEINKLYEKYHPQGVEFIGITRADSATIAESRKNFQIPYPEFVNMRDVMKQPIFGDIPGVPTTFIFDSDGDLFFKQIGYVEASVFETKLDSLLTIEKQKRKSQVGWFKKFLHSLWPF